MLEELAQKAMGELRSRSSEMEGGPKSDGPSHKELTTTLIDYLGAMHSYLQQNEVETPFERMRVKAASTDSPNWAVTFEGGRYSLSIQNEALGNRVNVSSSATALWSVHGRGRNEYLIDEIAADAGVRVSEMQNGFSTSRSFEGEGSGKEILGLFEAVKVATTSYQKHDRYERESAKDMSTKLKGAE